MKCRIVTFTVLLCLVLLAFTSIFAIVRSAKAPKNVPEISEDAE